MKIRIISSLIAAILLFAAMFMPVLGFIIIVSIIMMMAIYEYFSAFKKSGYNVSYFSTFLTAASIIPVWLLNLYNKQINNSKTALILLFWMTAVVILYMLICVFSSMKFNVLDVSVSVFGLLYIIIPFTFIILIRQIPKGFYLVWLVFLGAWITDTSAYFTGKFLGKRKIVPNISKNKTVAGFIGGIIGCTVVISFYGLWLQTKNIDINTFYYIIIGFTCGFMSQLGDWFASCVKRYLNIKDFGKIMPGHGGILDRFDSVFIIAPLIYVFIILLR